MKKRILGFLLSFVMLFSLIPISYVNAANDAGRLDVTVAADKTKAHPGDTVHFTLSIGAIEKLEYMELYLDISEGLQYVKKDSSDLAAENAKIKGTLKAAGFTEFVEAQLAFKSGGCDYGSTKSLTVIEFDCLVKEGFVGTATVGVKSDSFVGYYDPNADDSSAEYALNIKNASVEVEVPVSGVTVDPTKMELKDGGETKNLAAVIVPENATNKKVTFTSDNEDVATVDANGVVTSVAVGTAVITAKTADGNFTASCTVTVKHDAKPVAATDSTCKVQGNNAYYKCDGCGKCFKDSDCTTETTPAAEKKALLPHQYDETVWEKNADSHWHVCTLCNEEKSGEAAHSGGSATCQVLAKCEVCGQAYGKLSAHTLVAHAEIPADHNNTGNIAYWECSVCGKLFSDKDGKTEIQPADTVTDKIPHKFAETWTTNEDKHWKVCECGAVTQEEKHTLVWVTDKEATEEQTGLKHQECSVCGYVPEETKDTVIDKLQHVLTKVNAVQATCKAAGNLEYWTCSNCDKYFKDAEAKEAFASHDDVIAAKLAHAFAEEWKTDKTNHWHVCTLCGEEKSEEAAHTYGDWTVAKEATVSEEGRRERACTACGYKQTETIQKVSLAVPDDSGLLVINGQDAIDEAVTNNAKVKKALEKLNDLTALFEEVTKLKTDSKKAPSIVAEAEIRLTGTMTMPAGGMDITLKVPGVKTGDSCYFLLHLKSDGIWEQVPATAGEGTLTGHFTELSPVYVVKAENTKEVPKTGDVNVLGIFVLLMAGFAMAGLALFAQRCRVHRRPLRVTKR